jgi:predicted transcriptional regulator
LVASAVTSARKANPKPATTQAPDATDTAKPVAIRAGTKQAQIIAMLQRPEGATVAEMVAATGWLAHTVRGCISAALKKKLGLPIAAEKVEGRGTVYKLNS